MIFLKKFPVKWNIQVKPSPDLGEEPKNKIDFIFSIFTEPSAVFSDNKARKSHYRTIPWKQFA